MNASLPEKTCARCGRRFTWRKKWERDWEHVRYCSNACKRGRPGDEEHRLEGRILAAASGAPARGRPLEELARTPAEREPLRQAARRLALAGRISLLQSGRTIDPRDLHGPVRIASPK